MDMRLEIIRFLLDHGVSLTVLDEEYRGVPIDWALHSDLGAAVDLLTEHQSIAGPLL